MTPRQEYERRRVNALAAHGFAHGDRVQWRSTHLLRGVLAPEPRYSAALPDDFAHVVSDNGMRCVVPIDHLVRENAHGLQIRRAKDGRGGWHWRIEGETCLCGRELLRTFRDPRRSTGEVWRCAIFRRAEFWRGEMLHALRRAEELEAEAVRLETKWQPPRTADAQECREHAERQRERAEQCRIKAEAEDGEAVS